MSPVDRYMVSNNMESMQEYLDEIYGRLVTHEGMNVNHSDKASGLKVSAGFQISPADSAINSP